MICKTHGDLNEEQSIKQGSRIRCRQCLKDLKADWYERNKAKIAAKQVDYRANNKELVAKVKKESHDRNKYKYVERAKAYRAKYDDRRIRDRSSKNNKEKVAALKDYYVKDILTRKLKIKDIPQSLIDFKRVQIMLNRKITEVRKNEQQEEERSCELD